MCPDISKFTHPLSGQRTTWNQPLLFDRNAYPLLSHTIPTHLIKETLRPQPLNQYIRLARCQKGRFRLLYRLRDHFETLRLGIETRQKRFLAGIDVRRNWNSLLYSFRHHDHGLEHDKNTAVGVYTETPRFKEPKCGIKNKK